MRSTRMKQWMDLHETKQKNDGKSSVFFLAWRVVLFTVRQASPTERTALQKARFKQICKRLSKHSVNAENTADTVNTTSKQAAQLGPVWWGSNLQILRDGDRNNAAHYLLLQGVDSSAL